ncbi:MAG: hypothetical protein H6Q67_1823 [Firmicutes bacterium]|nr:hypothetical protein [Bacillota bacterium]
MGKIGKATIVITAILVIVMMFRINWSGETFIALLSGVLLGLVVIGSWLWWRLR